MFDKIINKIEDVQILCICPLTIENQFGKLYPQQSLPSGWLLYNYYYILDEWINKNTKHDSIPHIDWSLKATILDFMWESQVRPAAAFCLICRCPATSGVLTVMAVS